MSTIVVQRCDSPENANSGRTKRSRFWGFALLKTESARFRLLSTSPTCGLNLFRVSNVHSILGATTNLKTTYPHLIGSRQSTSQRNMKYSACSPIGENAMFSVKHKARRATWAQEGNTDRIVKRDGSAGGTRQDIVTKSTSLWPYVFVGIGSQELFYPTLLHTFVGPGWLVVEWSYSE